MAYQIEKQLSLFDLPEEPSSDFTQEEIDKVLILGGNTANHRIEIAAEFSKGKRLSSKVDFLKSMYIGGDGIGSVCAWYSDSGIKLSRSDSARWSEGCEIIPWEDAAEKISTLLSLGKFATRKELEEYPHFERKQIAKRIWYLESDLSQKGMEMNLLPSIRALRGGGFPADVDRFTESLNDPSGVMAFTRDMKEFVDVFKEDKKVLRFNYHHPERIYSSLLDLGLIRLQFPKELFEIPEASRFITEDEIDSNFMHGSGTEGGKNRIYEFYQKPHSMNDILHFLRKEYGTGGRSHALSGSPYSSESHDSDGIVLRKAGCKEVRISWKAASSRIAKLIKEGHY